MKTVCLSFLTVFCAVFCNAQITSVTDMEEVFHYFNDADAKTLAIFDVDMVLVQPTDPAFQMANMKRFGPIAKRIMKEVPVDKQMIFLSLMTISSAPVLIDARTPRFLNQLTQRGIPTMALTANLTGPFATIENMETWRITVLSELGIDFSKAAPYSKRLLFDDLAAYRGNFSTYLNGILFVNGTTVTKGEALLSFLEKTQISPNKVIFIDDREDNLKNVEAALQKLNRNIEFQGLHFTGAQNFPSKLISEAEFESRWQELASQATLLN